jgi:heme exporter protein C
MVRHVRRDCRVRRRQHRVPLLESARRRSRGGLGRRACLRVRTDGPGDGPLWGRKSWGIWWPWDARTTTALLLELVFVSYLLVRAYAGEGSDKLAAAVGLFGTAVAPFVYFSVNIWRTIHPLNTVVPTLSDKAPAMVGPFAASSLAFLLLFLVLLLLRANLSRQQATLDALYLAHED